MMMQSQALRTSTVHGQKVVAKSVQRSSLLAGRKATVQVECRSIEAGKIYISLMSHRESMERRNVACFRGGQS